MPLSLREKAAQLLFPRIGSNMNPPVRAAEDTDRIRRLVEGCPVGGLILFNGNVADTADTLAALQAESPVPLLVSADMERGAGQQVAGLTVFPHAMAYSALGRDAEDAAFESGRITGAEARSAGVHVTFAPTCDVNREQRNPIIATRAFGTQPEGVSRLISAYIHGLHEGGMLATAKHFPGHGNTADDSHATLPQVPSSRADLEANDLVPFRAAVAAGVDLVMTAHIVYPALDPASPATLSAPILQQLLRTEMGFEGAVITDSLLMGAVQGMYSPGELATRLVAAGVDILLDPESPSEMADGLERAVEEGRLEEGRLDEAYGRVMDLKRRLFGEDLSGTGTTGRVSAEEHRAFAARVAHDAVEIRYLSEGALPLRGDEDILFLLAIPFRTHLDPPEPPMAAAIRRHFPEARFAEIGPETTEEEYDRLMAAVGEAGRVVLAAIVKPAAWRRFGLSERQDQFFHDVLRQRPAIVVSLGVPHILEGFAGAEALICTYSDVPVSQMALVRRLAGA